MQFPLIVEGAVAILLALTIGYCIVLNGRLKRLHADRDTLRVMVTDLVAATNLANDAIKELKQTAVEADLTLSTRLDEATRFGVELANHVNAGTVLMERLAKIATLGRQMRTGESAEEPNRAQSALVQLDEHARSRGAAA